MHESLVSDLLERLGSLMRTERRQLASSHGLQTVHLEALSYLARANRYSDSPAALTDFLGSTKGTVSQTVGILERKGLLTKHNDPIDRRRTHLALTARGEEVVAAVDPLPGLATAIQGIDGAAGLAGDLEALLRELQHFNGSHSFGLCHSCRFFTSTSHGYRCGLTGEELSEEDREKICREHERIGD